MPQFDLGAWWLAYHGDDPVAFAGVVPSTYARNCGYFSRVGVLQRHRGRRLQLRLMRAVEARGRRIGWHGVVSDTTNNPTSANNFIRAGYRLYEPEVPWAWSHTLYWRRSLR
jgi:GNAT superfamily N-acetyltransferase